MDQEHEDYADPEPPGVAEERKFTRSVIIGAAILLALVTVIPCLLGWVYQAGIGMRDN